MNPLKIRFFLFFAVGCAFSYFQLIQSTKTVNFELNKKKIQLTSASAEEGKIFVYNEGAYSAKFSVSYDVKGELKFENSEELKHGERQFIGVPSEAVNVHLKVEKLGLKGFQTIFMENFTNPPQKCYKLDGTLLNSGYEEISCENMKEQTSEKAFKSNEIAEVGGQIIIVDNAENPVRVSLSYDLNGKHRNISDILVLGVNVKINIQKDATNVQLTIGDSFKQHFPGAVKKCYNISGADSNPKVKEISCKSEVVPSPQVTLSKNSTDADGYITVMNQSGYFITFTVSYDLNGISMLANSGDFSVGYNKTIPIPSGANNIHFDLKAYWLPGLVTSVYSQTFSAPVKQCYKFNIMGVMPC